VRDEFSKLDLDGKTAFLVEAIFSTAGSAINEISGRLSGLVGLVTDPFEASDDDASGDAGEEAEKPTEAEPDASSSEAKTRSRSKKK